MTVALVLVAACGGGPSGPTPTPAGYVSRAMLGDEWPLTVEDGVLRCEGSAVIIRVGGTDYAVNGAATGKGADIDPIWAADPSGISPKLSIGPLIDRGLALC